ncbi:hypothetical protein O181_100126 [Austropuccinia psidii MF-1]|uniref:Uncharacterized protein n=1 Tax=Austropuccinia psidii MF-1 TaxID=1389203 RepID=A0A9Q3JE64_9BASI|nr:hypothetical protein [Austropuccinia psidii MF-1]
MPSYRSGPSYKPSCSSQKGHRRDYGRRQSYTEGQVTKTTTRSLSGHLQSQPKGLKQCTSAQRVPDPCLSVQKLHEPIPDCKEIPGTSKHLQVTQWRASIDGKEEYDAFNSRMEEKQPTNTKASAKTSPSGQQKPFQCEKAATSSKKGKGKAPAPKPYSQGYRIPKIQKDAMENVFQMARTMLELQKKEEARLRFKK